MARAEIDADDHAPTGRDSTLPGQAAELRTRLDALTPTH
jgi:hypothetical protein